MSKQFESEATSFGRRNFLKLSATAGVAASSLVRTDGIQAGTDDEPNQQAKQLRKQAAQRRRRVIFNNDGADLTYAGSATPEDLLRPNTTGLLGSHVDTISYSSNFGFDMFMHDTQVGQVAFVSVPVHQKIANRAKIMKELLEQGTDPLRISCDFCRQHDLEIFWSFRMNDEHAAWVPEERSKYINDHPDHLLGTVDAPPPRGPWCGVDYAVPEVRDRVLDNMEDVCRRYDVDGIELDFFRQLICFKKTAWGEPMGQADCDMMTDLLRRMRTMMDEVGTERRRPLLIAVRVPDSVDYCKQLGYDLATWLRDDLIDIMIVGGYFWLNPWATSVQLGQQYGVPVYPSLDASRMSAKLPKEIRRSDEAYRAHAANAFYDGADGIYVFNLHYMRDPEHQLWRQLGDPKTLAELDKVYHVSVMGRGHPTLQDYVPDGEQYLNLPTLCPDHPLDLSPDQSHTTILQIADDVAAWKQLADGPHVQLDVMAEHLDESQNLTVSLNNHVLTSRALTWYPNPSNVWHEYGVDPDFLEQGVNDLTLKLAAGNGQNCKVYDVQLRIDYKLNGERRRDIAQSRGRYVAHHSSTV